MVIEQEYPPTNYKHGSFPEKSSIYIRARPHAKNKETGQSYTRKEIAEYPFAGTLAPFEQYEGEQYETTNCRD